MSEQFVRAEDYADLKRKYEDMKAADVSLRRAVAGVQRKSYEEGRDDARREYLQTRSKVEHGDKIASLTLPDNGGAIQFHVVGSQGPRPLTGGMLSPSPDFLLRIWGPPDIGGSYGVSEQGGGNLTDFSMTFDLTPDGIRIYRMDTIGVRTRWDKA